MKLYFHYCTFGFSNAYVLGSDDDAKVKEAIIVDPGSMNETILKYIEENEYNLKAVLITHDHLNHVHGLRTLKRIYDIDIYSINPVIRDHRTTLVRDGEEIKIGPFKTEIISVPGHSADSAVFRIEHLLFTGDALSAGLVGRTASTYAASTQITALRHKILSLPGDYTVLPGHGPPSTLEAERIFNVGINTYREPQNKRVNFKIDI